MTATGLGLRKAMSGLESTRYPDRECRACSDLSRAAVVVTALIACRSGSRSESGSESGSLAEARGPRPEAHSFPELDDLPRTAPIATVALASPTTPIASVVGPTLVGDIAVVGASHLGFVGIDWRAAKVAWSRSAGTRLAPPFVLGDDAIALIGDCTSGDAIGCRHDVAPAGVDIARATIRGDVPAFVAARGETAVLPGAGDRLIWIRGDAAISFGPDGDAVPVSAAPPPAIAVHGGKTFRIAIEDEALVARDDTGAEAWRIRTRFAAVLGVVPGQPHEVPMVRVAHLDGVSGRGFVEVLDIDATGSKRGQAAFPVPGIQLLGHGVDDDGGVVLAVRLDTTLRRDFLVRYDGRGNLRWVWPLPDRVRTDPIGVAIATDGHVVAFHDGDRVTILPPGEASKNATP
jgi:hypothetical protein